MHSSLDAKSLALLLGGEAQGNKVRAPGPGHSRADRSLTVFIEPDNPDGFTVHSFSGDDPIACKDYVRQKAGLPPFEPKRKLQQPQDAATATPKAYDYRDANGELLYQVCRLVEPKSFRYRRPDGNGGWLWSLGEERRVPYRLGELLKYPDANVFVCEGEKDADRVAELGHCATWVASGKWTPDCVQALAGRDVFIMEDNDEEGRRKAAVAAAALNGTAKSIRIVRLPDLPVKGDVSDWLDTDASNSERLIDICVAAPVWTPEMAETTEAAKLSEPRFRFETMADLRAMPPAEYLIDGWIPERSIGLLFGRWGTGKTFIGFDWALHLAFGLPDWHGARLPGKPCDVLIIAREGHAGFVKRVNAFMAHHGITEDSKQLIFMRSPISFLDDAGYAALAEEIKALGRPFRFVLVDTVGRVLPGQDMAKEAPITLFMERLQQVGELTGATSIGVHHENKSGDANGSMFFQNSSDFMFQSSREGQGPLTAGKLTCVKQKEGDDLWTRDVTFAKVALPDGTSSLVVESVVEGEAKKKEGISSRQKLALAALDEAVLSYGEPISPCLNLRGTAASIERWKAEIYARGVLNKDAAKPERDFQNLKNVLAAKSLIGERDGLVWRAGQYGHEDQKTKITRKTDRQDKAYV
jgi:hypothetical protein